jgi:hypothetical protein
LSYLVTQAPESSAQGKDVTSSIAYGCSPYYIWLQAPESTAGNGGAKDAAEAWEDQLNMLIGKKWCNAPPQSRGAVNPDDGVPPLLAPGPCNRTLT